MKNDLINLSANFLKKSSVQKATGWGLIVGSVAFAIDTIGVDNIEHSLLHMTGRDPGSYLQRVISDIEEQKKMGTYPETIFIDDPYGYTDFRV